MLVKIVGNTTYGHALKIGSIAVVKRTTYSMSGNLLDCVGKNNWDGPSPLYQILGNRDVRRIPHNKANLRAFAKQQKHFYKKAK